MIIDLCCSPFDNQGPSTSESATYTPGPATGDDASDPIPEVEETVDKTQKVEGFEGNPPEAKQREDTPPVSEGPKVNVADVEVPEKDDKAQTPKESVSCETQDSSLQNKIRALIEILSLPEKRERVAMFSASIVMDKAIPNLFEAAKEGLGYLLSPTSTKNINILGHAITAVIKFHNAAITAPRRMKQSEAVELEKIIYGLIQLVSSPGSDEKVKRKSSFMVMDMDISPGEVEAIVASLAANESPGTIKAIAAAIFAMIKISGDLGLGSDPTAS